jgi:hypothetical protein
MPIPLNCPCGRTLHAKDELAGRQVKCPQCGAILTVPKPEPKPEEEEIGLLPLDDPEKEPPPQTESASPAAAEIEELDEVLPVDADEEDSEDEDEVSVRERIRRREERQRERAERREDEERAKRRRRRRKQEEFDELVEQGRYRVHGGRGYFGNFNGSLGAGIALLVFGFGISFVVLLLSSAAGKAVVVAPVGLIVVGIFLIIKGLQE